LFWRFFEKQEIEMADDRVENGSPKMDRRGVLECMVTNHIRGLLAPQPFDIASSDRHEIKPWFTSRLPESPQIVDLSGDGFSLLGGRVDVLGEQPVATVVYRHGGHTISLTTLRGSPAVSGESIAGYNVRTWREGEFTYCRCRPAGCRSRAV
jgi:anti-sigma factor RsiW